MKKYWLIVVLSLVILVPALAQEEIRAPFAVTIPEDSPEIEQVVVVAAAPPEIEFTSDKNDPGYEAYQKGYNLILDEQWNNAIKQLEAMMNQYPKSQYVDDAAYWIAYAYKHVDEKKSKEQYKKFIKKYPHSSYYDDAVADLGEMDDNLVISISGDTQNVVISKAPGAYSYGMGTTMKLAEQQIKMTQRLLNNGVLNHRWIKSYGALPKAWTLVSPKPAEKLDQETQLKLDALNALGDKKDDENVYITLKDIAVDPKENKTLRVAALDQLVDFKKHDPLPVFVEVAKKDTSEEIQNLAVDYIGSLSTNKNRSVETLADLFSAVPSYRRSQRQMILSSIAEIGNDKAVDFLGSVARTNEDHELRSSAVYYLGSIGTDKSRGALLEIIKVKK